MFRAIIILLCVAASGCTDIREVFMPVHAKVSKAFPPNAEVRVAEEGLRAFIQQDQTTSKSFEEQYASRLELRALTCTQGLSIGRFDLVATVKSFPLSRDCLNTQDAQLAQYLGIRQVAVRFSQPPLRPLAPLGLPSTVPSAGISEIYSGSSASGAGVAVLRGTRSELISIEIPGGKKIASLPTITETLHRVLLSPNGRVTAIQIGNSGVTFVDTETGAKLWDTKDITQLHAWMPEISAALASDSKNGAMLLIDFQAGKIEPHTVGLRSQTWALPVSGSPSRVLLGSQKAFSLVEHARAREGVKGSIIKEFHIKQGQGVTSSPPTLMLSGKAIFFISLRDFMAVDLESGKETFWPTGAFLGNRYGKLSETTLLVDSYELNGFSTKPWVFNIEQSTLSPVQTEEGKSGILAELVGRTGYMRRGQNQMWFGDEVKAGEPAPLDSLLASFNLERQLARLTAETRAAEAPSGRGSYDIGAPAPAIPSGSSTNGLIANLARDAQVEAVGLYKGGAGATTTTTDGRKMGYVEVRIRRSAKPVVLVLSSYEPVRWMLISESGAKLAAVLVSGYYPSQVIGAGAARIVMTGSTYAYKLDSPQYNALNQETMRWTGKGIGVFQGRYEGGSFSVGG